MQEDGDTGPVQGTIRIQNIQGGPFNWSSSTTGNISISPASGTLYPGESVPVVVTVSSSGLVGGLNPVGDIDFAGYALGENSNPTYISVPVIVYVGDFIVHHLAIIRK
jgi:hypothetical protein